MRGADDAIVEGLQSIIQPIDGPDGRWDSLLARLGEARCVLLGEATHGTDEFYRARAAITRRLIEAHGFTAVAFEADWPDMSRVHAWTAGGDGDDGPDAALAGFRRFPAWMWRNTAFREFVDWVRDHNAGVPAVSEVGLYGLDLYALHGAIGEVLTYLSRVDDDAYRLAKLRYSCFDAFRADPAEYASALLHDRQSSCEGDVVEMLTELIRKEGEWASSDGPGAAADHFFALQNARLVRNAEAYYRTMFRGGAASWNLRDSHMAGTCDELLQFLGRQGRPPKLIVWAHNSHLGDARATQMGAQGEHNVGQLLTQRWGREVVRVGFTTWGGTVTAANDWGDPPHHMRINPALPGSVEALFHATEVPAFLLELGALGEAAGGLREEHLERAIGVIYRPGTERWSHYFDVRLPEQFDFVVHFDRTLALEPLDRGALWRPDELPEAYPSGL